jgi:cytochrome c oxidase subunit 2
MGCVVLLAASDASARNLSIFDPASPQAEAIRNLSYFVFAVSALIFVVVEGVLFYAIWRFRRSPASPATEPPQVYGSKPIEIAWTVAPALIVFLLVLVTARTLWEVKVPVPKPQPGDQRLFVTVVGRQWWWEYQYDHYNGEALGFATANELHVPASETGLARSIYLTLKSADVAHSFWVPRLAGKTDLIPGQVNSLWFETEQPDLYLGQCAEYCGTQHANMLLRVVVEPREDFERWLSRQRKPAVEDPQARAGRELFLAQSCVNCHRVRGTPAAGTYAPDLTHLMSRATLAAGMIANTPENLRHWLADPQRTKPGCLMPAFGLGATDYDRIAEYLQTLR